MSEAVELYLPPKSYKVNFNLTEEELVSISFALSHYVETKQKTYRVEQLRMRLIQDFTRQKRKQDKQTTT